MEYEKLLELVEQVKGLLNESECTATDALYVAKEIELQANLAAVMGMLQAQAELETKN